MPNSVRMLREAGSSRTANKMKEEIVLFNPSFLKRKKIKPMKSRCRVCLRAGGRRWACVCVSVYLCICVSVYLCVCVSVCLCVCVSRFKF